MLRKISEDGEHKSNRIRLDAFVSAKPTHEERKVVSIWDALDSVATIYHYKGVSNVRINRGYKCVLEVACPTRVRIRNVRPE